MSKRMLGDISIDVAIEIPVDDGFPPELLVPKNGKWVPTFPKAKYIFSKQEFDMWNPAEADHVEIEINQNVFNDSVLPVVEAGQAQMVNGEHQLNDNMLIKLAPGHTRGSIVMEVESKGHHALFAGDTLHSPIQILRPEWSSGFCLDPVQSGQTRRKLMEHCADKNALLMPAHFPPPHAVRVRRDGNNFTFTPE